MTALVHDLRFGLRMLRRRPTTTLIALATLALGIGANTAVFTIVDATLLRPLPFEEPDRLVFLYATRPARGWRNMTVSAPDVGDWAAQGDCLDSVGIYGSQAVNVMGDDQPDRLLAIRASAGVLQVLRTEPVLGHAYDASYDREDAPPVVLLADSTWRARFGADSRVVGSLMTIDGVPHEVLGVLPPQVEAAVGRFDLWTPFSYGAEARDRSSRGFMAVARLRQGLTVARADQEMKVIGDRLAEAFPDSNRGHTVSVASLSDELVGGDTRSALLTLCAAVGFVLLIACVNIANLMLATTAGRRRELAIRTALGAGPRRLVRQLLTESALLATGGAALGIAVAHWFVGIVISGLEAATGPVASPQLDGRALAFTAALLVVTSLGFGMPVAIKVARSGLGEAVRAGASTVVGRRNEGRQRDVMVVVQVALALALLSSAGLMVRSLAALRAVDPGFETDHLLTLRVSLPEGPYPSDAQRSAFFERAVEEISAVAGVRRAAAASMIPLVGDSGCSTMSIEEHPITDPADKVMVGNQAVTPGYLETMGIPLVDGRSLSEHDRSDAPGVVLINQTMARHYWPDESAVGKMVKFGPLDCDMPWLKVVGVVGDYRHTSLDMGPRFEALYPQLQMPSSSMTFVVRTDGDPTRLAADIQSAIWRVDPGLAVFQVASMAEIVDRNTRSIGDLAGLLGGLGVVALVMAAGGLFGTLSHSVRRQTHEIGVRMALGADWGRILRQVLGRCVALVLAGTVAGWLLAWLLSRWLQGMLYGTSTLDVAAYIVAAAVLFSASVVAGLVPATRAARIDPVTALRFE